MVLLRRLSDLRDATGLDARVAAKHRLDRLAVPAEVDERLLSVADAVDEFVDEADPLVEVGVLHGVAVVRCAVVVYVRAKAVASDHTLVACDGDVHFHALGEALPAGSGDFQLLLKAAPRRIEEERRPALATSGAM